MIVINNINDKYFELDGVTYAKIYQPLKQGLNGVAVYNTRDTRQQLVSSTKYDQFIIDGVAYGSQSDLIAAMLPVIFLEDAIFDYSVTNYTGDNVTNEITNHPDEEDLTEDGSIIKLKNRQSNNYGQKGYFRVPSDFDFSTMSSNLENTIIEIRFYHDLNGQEITFPEGCKLKFNGGVLFNALLNFQDNFIYSVDYQIFKAITKGSGSVNFEKCFPENFGAIGGGVIDDTISIQSAIDFLGSGGRLYFNQKTYLISQLTISFPFQFTSNFPKGSRYQTSLQCSETEGSMIKVRSSLFQVDGISFVGSSDVSNRGADIDLTAIEFTGELSSGNVDASVSNCSFLFFYKIFELKGRNLKVSNSVLSNSNYGFYVDAIGVSDFRGLESFDNRYHSIGSLGANASVFFIDSSSNFFDVKISGYSDDCSTFFDGFSGETIIDSVLCTKLDDQFLNIDASNTSLTFNRRNFVASNNIIHIFDNSLTPKPCISINGPLSPIIQSNLLNRPGGDGIEINTLYTICQNNVVSNAGGFSDLTYYGINVKGNGDHSLIKNNTIKEDVYVSESGNNAAAAIRLDGTSCVLADNDVQGFDGKEMEVSSGVYVFGQDLRRKQPRVSYSNSVPNSGNWYSGDCVLNTDLSIDSNGCVLVGWKRITTGSGNTSGTDWAPMQIKTISE